MTLCQPVISVSAVSNDFCHDAQTIFFPKKTLHEKWGEGWTGIVALFSATYLSESVSFSKYASFCVSKFLPSLMEVLFMCFINLQIFDV